MMSLIQAILLLCFFVALLCYIFFLRSPLRDRLIAILLFSTASVAVLVPDSTQRVANLVGVGRGTDLTFYLFAVAFVFAGVLTYAKISAHSRILTELIRKLAISEAIIITGEKTSPRAQSLPE